jgi:hypothetical protein
MAQVRAILTAVRPFAHVRWPLAAALVGSLLLLLLGQTCSRGPRYAEVVALALVPCVLLWANHVAMAPIAGLKGLAVLGGRALLDLAALVALFVLLSIPVVLLTPHVSCYTDRSAAAEVLLSGSILRSEVEANAVRLGSVVGAGRGVKFEPTSRAPSGLVTEDGTIITVGEDPPVVFTLTPALTDGKVTWKCRGYPEKVAPGMCKGDK